MFYKKITIVLLACLISTPVLASHWHEKYIPDAETMQTFHILEDENYAEWVESAAEWCNGSFYDSNTTLECIWNRYHRERRDIFRSCYRERNTDAFACSPLSNTAVIRYKTPSGTELLFNGLNNNHDFILSMTERVCDHINFLLQSDTSEFGKCANWEYTVRMQEYSNGLLRSRLPRPVIYPKNHGHHNYYGNHDEYHGAIDFDSHTLNIKGLW